MVKNVFIIILLSCAAAGGYYALSTYRIDLGSAGKTEVLRRGDLTLPINATGEVRPRRQVQMKAEASGEVIEIFKRAGERVKKGELLIRLDRSEEERNRNRAQQELDRSKALREASKVRLQQRKTADLDSGKAELAVIEATLPYYKFRAEKAEDSWKAEDGFFHEEELIQRRTTYENQLAQRDAARARLASVQLAILQAEQEVAQMEATYASAQSMMGDAEERLEKTDIIAPCDGIIGNVFVQEGEVIQGGKTTITGGTLLADVLDDSRLLVQAEVDEADIGAVQRIAPPWARPGNEGFVLMPEDWKEAAAMVEQLPNVTVEAFRDEDFEGVIERIYPVPRTISGVTTYMVDVWLENSEDRKKLFSGMRAEVEFTAERVEDVLLCPNEAIRRGSLDELGVYLPVKSEDPAGPDRKFVSCKIGLDNGVYSEVTEGLVEGDEVYTKLPRKGGDGD